MPVAVSVVLEARPAEIDDAQDDDRIPPELAAELAMGSARFEPLLAGGAVGMLSIEPAAAGASPELHTLLPLVAAAVAASPARSRATASAPRPSSCSS